MATAPAPLAEVKAPTKTTQIRATKIGVWKIGDRYFEDFETTEREVRRLVVLELLAEQGPDGSPVDEKIAQWIAANWAAIEKRVKEALAGS